MISTTWKYEILRFAQNDKMKSMTSFARASLGNEYKKKCLGPDNYLRLTLNAGLPLPGSRPPGKE
jgi:hypothetical protein